MIRTCCEKQTERSEVAVCLWGEGVNRRGHLELIEEGIKYEQKCRGVWLSASSGHLLLLPLSNAVTPSTPFFISPISGFSLCVCVYVCDSFAKFTLSHLHLAAVPGGTIRRVSAVNFSSSVLVFFSLRYVALTYFLTK